MRRADRQRLVALLTRYPLPYTGHEGYKTAEVTGGGVPLTELHAATLESRVAPPKVHLCGELLDAFGPIGGYNFLWAWVTGRVAGRVQSRMTQISRMARPVCVVFPFRCTLSLGFCPRSSALSVLVRRPIPTDHSGVLMPSFDTLAVHAGERMPRPDFTPVATPIYHSAAYVYENLDDLDAIFAGTQQGPVYARYGNPTLTALEIAVAALEGGEAALAYASGMAAIHGALLGAGAGRARPSSPHKMSTARPMRC